MSFQTKYFRETIFKINQISFMRKQILYATLLLALITLFNLSCKKQDNTSFNEAGQTKAFSSEVPIKWLDMQLNLLRVPLAAGTASQASERAIAYCGIALYEAVVPGMPSNRSLGGQLNQLPLMPASQPGVAYHWGASANAALAYMNRKLFPNTSAANNTAIDSLENKLQAMYSTQVDAATLQRSVEFGQAVAKVVFDWAQGDGILTMPAASTYVLPVGLGLWEKTPPNFAGPVNPFYSMKRLLVTGSDAGSAPVPPPAYSTDPSSDFYKMAKDVYDKSLNLTAEQTAMAIYHRDVPGYPGGGTLVAILSQVIQKAGSTLDVAALAYAKTGIGYYDAITLCFIEKYTRNVVRPITYIRNIMGYSTWSPLFATPGHPEFPAAHAVNGGSFSVMLTDVYGSNFNFTLKTYAYLGLPDRNYKSFDDLAIEMANSRVFGGIHYQPSCDKGIAMGKKVANNILGKLKFLK